MKIAVVSDDKVNISQHFGRAPYYMVVTIEDGRVVSKEARAKAGHQTFAAHEPEKIAPGERHGYEAGSQSRHAMMAETIQDCQTLIVGGMGWGAYEAMQGYGIQPVATDVKDIDEAIRLYLEDKLENLMDRLH